MNLSKRMVTTPARITTIVRSSVDRDSMVLNRQADTYVTVLE